MSTVPFGNDDAKLAIINNGKIVHTARNYGCTYTKKQIFAGKKRRKKNEDQNSVQGVETKGEKWYRAKALFLSLSSNQIVISVLMPQSTLLL